MIKDGKECFRADLVELAIFDLLRERCEGMAAAAVPAMAECATEEGIEKVWQRVVDARFGPAVSGDVKILLDRLRQLEADPELELSVRQRRKAWKKWYATTEGDPAQ